jgi:hypothetical protein
MRHPALILFVVLTFLLVPSITVSQNSSEPTVRYKKKTEIDFEDVTVAGALKRPHGSYMLEKRQSRFNPLIKLKENFDREMLKSVEQMR